MNQRIRTLMLGGAVLAASAAAAWGQASGAPSGAAHADTAAGQAARSDATPRQGTVPSADGLEIWYERRGAGDTALLFVHCWSCDHEFWREQVGAFSDRYQVVTLDLGGHGRSRGDRSEWRIEGLAPDVVAVADELDLDRIILVGHSMGGPVSLEAARLLGDRVLGVVAVDTLHDVTTEYPEEEVAAFIDAFEADFEGTLRGMFAGMAGAQMDPALANWIVEKAAAADPEVAISLLGDFPELDAPVMFEAAGVPIRAINAAPGAGVPVTNIEANRRHADFEAVIMGDVGHFLQLEAPDVFNAHLAEISAELAENGAAPGSR